LAYDGGQEGATIQKISRCLTPDQIGKVGRVVSLSFDPNRDYKFDSIILDTASRLVDSRKISMTEAVRLVVSTVPLFNCGEHGAVRYDESSYIEEMTVGNRLRKQLGKSMDLFRLKPELTEGLIDGVVGSTEAKQIAAEMGKTFLDKGTKKDGKKGKGKAKDPNIEMLKQVLETIAENIDVVVYGAGCRDIDSAFEKYDNNQELSNELYSIFNVKHGIIKQCLDDGVLNRKLLELIKF
jgi:hypothetical protein